MKKRLVILGSTGSIGRQALEVVSSFPDSFEVVALAAGKSVELLARQVEECSPRFAVMIDGEHAQQLEERLQGSAVTILHGSEGLEAVASLDGLDLVVSAMVGMAGLVPTLAALRRGTSVALANKEALVVGGPLMTGEARAHGAAILPVDSEHSAIFQALRGEDPASVARLVLTSSGGPFRTYTADQMQRATVEEALNHPTWKMGSKVTIDSATMMNKGLEILEAHHLFGVPLERIEVLVHPQSIIHSLVEFVDGSVIAQLSPPDMRLPIQYALGYPERLPKAWKSLRLHEIGSLTFEAPREDLFPCLALARRAGETGGTMPAVMNGANEVAVERFLAGSTPFRAIPEIISAVMDSHAVVAGPGLDELIAADAWAREAARDASSAYR